MKDISALAQIAIRTKNHDRRNKRSTKGDLGLSEKFEGTDQERDLQTKKGVSFSQSEIPNPGPVNKKTLLSYAFKSWFGKSKLRNKKTGQPVAFYHGSKTFGIDNTGSRAFDDEALEDKTGSPMAV